MPAIPARYTFTIGERLKSRKIIDELFRRKSFYSCPGFRLYYITLDIPLSDSPAQYAFAVSKKHFPKAPDRNRVKRLMREAVRLRKADWVFTPGKQVAFLLMYTGQQLPEYATVEKAVEKLFGQRG
jgi:ribonuclease P protein component